MANESLSTEARMLKLIQKLHANTVNGKVKWERTTSSNVFQASFSNYALRISVKQESSEAPDYYLYIKDEQGITVESTSDTDIEQAIPGSGAYKLMGALHEMARRQALGVDKALDSLLEELE